ncbi:MAG TPA: FliM/FliN family flagellar motor C-terminal domain-containing protein [Pirellulales bacterium]|nr:FliM/FliN family flagellar motor C-terminal domain-containing protein [Pirellulales bacterium]
MPTSLPEAFAQILAQCQAGRDEIAQAFERSLGEAVSVSANEPAAWDADRIPADLSGPGLAMAFVGPQGVAILLLAESSGLVPSWYNAPDTSQRGRLATLAQELGMLALPDSLGADDFQFRAVPSLADVARHAKPKDGAQAIELSLKGKSHDGIARLIWPMNETGFPTADAPPVASPAGPPVQAAAAAAPAATPNPKAAPAAAHVPAAPKRSAIDLPDYTRSLLHIRVPISVTLATKRQPIGQIMELGAGSIIHFDKSCEEMLDLYVGEHRVAKGEAVKVGEKFGLRITSVILPEERFKPVPGR